MSSMQGCCNHQESVTHHNIRRSRPTRVNGPSRILPCLPACAPTGGVESELAGPDQPAEFVITASAPAAAASARSCGPDASPGVAPCAGALPGASAGARLLCCRVTVRRSSTHPSTRPVQCRGENLRDAQLMHMWSETCSELLACEGRSSCRHAVRHSFALLRSAPRR